MDVPYRIPGGVVPGSAALESPPLLPDSKSLLSKSDIFARSAIGSCGVDPGPAPLRLIETLPLTTSQVVTLSLRGRPGTRLRTRTHLASQEHPK